MTQPARAHASQDETVAYLLHHYGKQTYADEANIHLRDTPAPLFQLLVLSLLLSARIPAENAVSAAASLKSSGLTTPEKMAKASWQERVDAITWSGYKRYDERTSTMLGESASIVNEKYGGDLRNLRRDADGDISKLHKALQEFKGIGAVGASIFTREVQSVWDEFYPYADDPVLSTARELSLPHAAESLAELCPKQNFVKLCGALIRVKLGGRQDEVRRQADA